MKRKRPSVLYSFIYQTCGGREHDDDVNHKVGPQILLEEAEQSSIGRAILE